MSRFAKEAGNCAGGQGLRIVSNLGEDKSMGRGHCVLNVVLRGHFLGIKFRSNQVVAVK